MSLAGINFFRVRGGRVSAIVKVVVVDIIVYSLGYILLNLFNQFFKFYCMFLNFSILRILLLIFNNLQAKLSAEVLNHNADKRFFVLVIESGVDDCQK